MSMFATVTVSNEIDLPHFPEEINRDDLMWQSKQGLDRYGGPYRITAEGRLERKEKSYRAKTKEKKQAEAKKWGFGSWEKYVQAYEENDGLSTPDEVDWDREEDGYEDHPPTIRPREQTVDEEWWADHNMHGTFEFHQIIRRDPIEYKTLGDADGETVEHPSEYALDVYIEYEARFTKGDLDEIVFMGDRASASDDPIGEALDAIDEWREWRASNASRLDGDNE